jgi:uncharacterized protein
MKFQNPQALDTAEVSELNLMMQEAQVKNYLANNPDFLQKNPQLLTHMELSHDPDGATSLVERQIKVLRERNQVMQSQLIEMLHSAHNNEQLLIQTNHFMLNLLQANNLQSLCHKAVSLLKQDFDIDDVAIALIDQQADIGPAKLFDNVEQIKALLNCQFPDSQPLCGRLEKGPKLKLFGEQAQDLESFAIIPLGESCGLGLLVLASKDAHRFEPEMGTLFIELIANLMSHLLQSYETS